MTHEGGVRHPIASTIGASAGAVSSANSNSAHTGAGFFIIDKHGWLAGAGHQNIWQSFGGDREGNESAWETAARELKQETGIPAEHLVSLAPPFTMRKDAHVYVLHIARVASGYGDSPAPSRELTRFKHFSSFGDAFQSELGNGEIVHRRDIEPEFLTIAAEIHRALSMRAQAAAVQLSQPPDSDFSAPSVLNTQQADNHAVSGVASPSSCSSADDDLLPRYPLLHQSNFFNHEESGCKHARILANRVARSATWIDARGQQIIDRHLRKSDTEKRRREVTREQAKASRVRRTIGRVDNTSAGLYADDTPLSVAVAVQPIQLVPDESQRFPLDAKPQSPAALHKRGAASAKAVDTPYSAPTTMSREAVFLSPPIGALGAVIPFFDLVRLCPERSHTPPSTVLPRTAHSIQTVAYLRYRRVGVSPPRLLFAE